MKAYFIGLVIMGGCLLYGCHTKQKKGENSSDYSADSQSIARQDTLPLPTDTHAASSVSTEGWTAKQIRDSIELFFGKEYDTLPPASPEDPQKHGLPLEHGRLRLPTAYHSGSSVCKSI